ncbi:MAG: flagellar export protein FliJ [Pseudomonadota bacterium]
MSRFRFSLEPVLRYRRHLEQQAQLELALAEHVVLEIKETINALKTSRELTVDELRNEEQYGTSGRVCQAYQKYFDRIAQEIEFNRRQLQEAVIRCNHKRDAVAETSKRKKVMERLNENAMARYQQEENLLEQKSNDELTVLRRRLIADIG